MKKQSIARRPKIAHFGAFDHDSYGDLIFPWIAEHLLPSCDLTHVSPTGNPTLWPDAKPTLSVAEAFARDDWDGVLVGGGDIIQTGEWATRNWAQTPLLSVGALPSLWCGASLLAAKLNIPCVWNCPGVPKDISLQMRPIAIEAVRSVDYLCVRDNLSAVRMNKLLTRPALVAPDTALDVCEMWPANKSESASKRKKPLVLSFMPRDACERWYEVEALLDTISARDDFSGEVIILPLMGWQNDTGVLTQNLKFKSGITVIVRDRSISLKQCALEIASSLAYVGNSLHGLITAISYRVPGVLVKPLGCEENTKYAGFADQFASDAQLIASSFAEAAVLLSEESHISIANAASRSRDHWRIVSDTFHHKQGKEKREFWQILVDKAGWENEQMLMHGVSAQAILNKGIERDAQHGKLNQTVAERDASIQKLGQALTERDAQTLILSRTVTERDIQIGKLSQVVVKKDGVILSLGQALAERDAQTLTLSRTVTERNGQIDSLNQAMTERDGQIDSLNQAVAERDGQIDSLNQAVTERDCQIESAKQTIVNQAKSIASFERSLNLNKICINLDQMIISECEEQFASYNQTEIALDEQVEKLKQTIIEHNEQIANITKFLAERDGQIANLKDETVRITNGKNCEIDHLRTQLNQIVHSRTWRATGPLRKVVLTFRQGIWIPSVAVIKKFTEFLRLRRDSIIGSNARHIRNSSLFDAVFYLARNPDVQGSGMDPAKHYLLHGWREHRDPSAAFNTSQYLFDNPDVAQAHTNPLLHYLRYGHRERRPIGQGTNSSSATSGTCSINSDIVAHEELLEAAALPVTHPHPQASKEVIDAEVEAIRKSGLFDEPFYRSMYTDLLHSQDAIREYCEFGWREGRNPSDDFDTNFYLATYSDIRNAGINPFWHYVIAGATEMRQAIPNLATRYEDDIRFGDVETDIKLLAFYSSPTWSSLRSGRPMFKGHTQPPFPHDELGFYDPAAWRVLEHQAEFAKCHGIYGFCFDIGVGTAVGGIPQPVESFLSHTDIDFGFCVRAELTSVDALPLLADSIVRAVSDRRYIRITDRPLILLTIPDNGRYAAGLLGKIRSLLADQGISNPFVIGRATGDESSWDGFVDRLCDAMLDLPNTPVPGETGDFLPLSKNGVDVVPYSVVATHGVTRVRKVHGSYPLYHAVTLGRDNTAQRSDRPLVYTRFHVRDYRRWLDAAIVAARAAHSEDRRLVFLNGWNDWDEGLFLEPDQQGGFCRVNETTRALLSINSGLFTPKVSVIVPNYNHEPYLRRRLDSIYGQSYKNIEVILMDDCSSDRSRELMAEYAAAHPSITRTLFNEKNSGSAFRQWAKGINAATGDLVWVAESDDYCDDRFLEVLTRSFDDESVLLAYSKCVFVSKDEVPLRDEFKIYLSDLECAKKWGEPYVETAHNEVRSALGIKNTIPNASGVIFKRPINMSLLKDESWLSMAVAGDWVFYLHIIRGGKIAYNPGATNFFRRYEGSTAEVTYKKRVFYREVGLASRTVAALYNVPLDTLEKCRKGYKAFYEKMVGKSDEEFALWYDYESILEARKNRLPNVLVSTMAFFPGGAEILPIRLANEFKRQGLSVLLLNAGLMCHEDRIRRMLQNDVPLVETSSAEDVKAIIRDFGVEVLNTHQWHVQKYPLQVPDVFDELRAHVASLHGMIEHGDAFGVTEEQLRTSDQSVTTWVYTAEKNIVPFSNFGLFDKSSPRFVKMPNGMQPPNVVPIPRAAMDIPDDAFALCCVSRAIPDKGWAETILVVNKARELSGRDIRLILVGNGPVYDEYCRVGVPDFVYLAGFSENSVGHYAAADMGIMLTKFKSESFPLTIVDCLFAGKPYIASDVGDIRNMLTTSDDVAGEVIELDNWEVQIEKVAQVVAAFATDKKKYANALALVQDVASRYKIDVVASQYVRLFVRNRNEHRLRSSGRSN